MDLKDRLKRLKEQVDYSFKNHESKGGQMTPGIKNPICIASCNDLGIKIEVNYFRSKSQNKELAKLLMDLAIDELIK